MPLRRLRSAAAGCLLAGAAVSAVSYLPVAHAGFLTTAEAVGGALADPRGAAAARQAVREQLIAWGVPPAEAQVRVARLSDAEVQRVVGRLQELPAGGTDLIGAAVFVFLVLLATDILGYTDVFPFVRDDRR